MKCGLTFDERVGLMMLYYTVCTPFNLQEHVNHGQQQLSSKITNNLIIRREQW
jgi:hypothetical protein